MMSWPIRLQSFTFLTLLLASWTTVPTEAQDICSLSFSVLEYNLLSSEDNRFNLLRAFYPPRDAQPVFVTVNYTFVGSDNSSVDSRTWYWSESEFYLIQPLEIFQFTSLFFSNFANRQGTLDLVLGTGCAETSTERMEMLTQRLKLYAQSATTSPDSISQKISDDYLAVAASRDEVEADTLQSDFVKAWLHIFLILFPIGSGIMLYLCDPIQLLLGDKVWQKLEDDHNHPTVAAIIQISVIFTVFVFVVDWIGFAYTLKNDIITYDNNSAFYLSVVTGLIFDAIAFVWVMFVLATSCHWDFKNMWNRWRKQACTADGHDRVKKLLCTIMFAPGICIANHLHYIVLALMSDPYHAGSTGIVYGMSFFLYYFIFRQFYARVMISSSDKQQAKIASKVGVSPQSQNRAVTPLRTPSSLSYNYPHRSPQTPFNTQAVVFGLMLIGPLLVLYQAIIIILFARLPLSKTLEDSPSRIYTIYQGTGLLIVALLTYNIILHPSPFSLTRAIEKIAKELQIPEEVRGWNKLSDEEKSAYIVSSLYHKQPNVDQPDLLTPDKVVINMPETVL